MAGGRHLLSSHILYFIKKECRRWDLNPHGLNDHRHLKPARLPIPPLLHVSWSLSQPRTNYTDLYGYCQQLFYFFSYSEFKQSCCIFFRQLYRKTSHISVPCKCFLCIRWINSIDRNIHTFQFWHRQIHCFFLSTSSPDCQISFFATFQSQR